MNALLAAASGVAVFVIAIIFIAAYRYGTGRLAQIGRAIFEMKLRDRDSVPDRIKVRERLQAKYAKLRFENGETAMFLFQEAKAAFDRTQVGIAAIDGKAGTLIGLISTGIAAVTIFGDSSKLAARTPYLFFAAFLFVTSLFCAVLALPTRRIVVPRLNSYSILSIGAVNDMKPRVIFELTESWMEATRRADAIGGGKSRLLLISTFVLVLAVFFLAVNWCVGIENGTQHSTRPLMRQTVSHPRGDERGR